MKNFKEICRLLMLIAFFCTLLGVSAPNAIAQQEVVAGSDPNKIEIKSPFQTRSYSYDAEFNGFPQKTSNGDNFASYESCQKNCTGKNSKCVLAPGMQTYTCVDYGSEESTTPNIGSNSTQNDGVINGCSKNTGLFSGLINTGSKIFQGLRDLIYVVAGFGIIGVAVGGFFGNLNWKWLGAIVIALVVIASTGELITAITGCTDFTQNMITDTLK